MKVIRGLKNLKRIFRRPVVTMGVFDGMHRGHQVILRKVVKRAEMIRGTSIVLTFDPHPNRILERGSSLPLLLSIEHRLRLIERLGIDVCIVVRFTRRMARWGAEYFVKKVLINKLGMVEFIVGYSHTFGYRKKGRISFLQELADRYGFTLTIVPPVKVGMSLVSSSRIRSLIRRGRLNQASELLGRPVSLFGCVRKGKARGRLLGYPTANINPHNELVPPEGVYAVLVRWKEKVLGGIMNIGKRPTFGEEKIEIEVHIFDLKARLYSEELEVLLVKRLRPVKVFSSPQKLVAQLQGDEKKARQILKKLRSHQTY